MAQNDGDGGSEAGGVGNETLAAITNRLLDHFFGAFVAKIQDLDPLTDDRLQRYYRQLSDEERNMVTANMLIHSGEAMYSQGLVKESISMWKCALDMYNIDTGGLKLQVAMAVPMYLSTVAHAGKVYKDIMGTLKVMLSSFDQETDSAKRMRVPYPEIRCRISTVLTSLEFHFSTITAPIVLATSISGKPRGQHRSVRSSCPRHFQLNTARNAIHEFCLQSLGSVER